MTVDEQRVTPDTADIVVVTALPEEQHAVVAALGEVEVHRQAGRDVHVATVGGLRVAAVPLFGMGNVGASDAAQHALRAWRASHLLLVGIAGGARGEGEELLLGDVLVPDQVLGYEAAKVVPAGQRRRWETYRPAYDLLATAKSVTTDEWVPQICKPRPAEPATARTAPEPHFGPVFSGEKVIADGAYLDELRRDWPKAVGVEMESLGVALAAYRGGGGFLMVKGVSDLADVRKDDRWRAYAAEAAARFAVAVLRREPVPPRPRQVTYSGMAKVEVCRALVDDWTALADYFGVQPHEQARFSPGDEARGVWRWLEVRRRLGELPAALVAIGRPELAERLGRDR